MSETIQFEEKEYRAYEELAKKAGFKTVDKMVNEALEHFILTEVIEREEVIVKVPKKLLAFFRQQKTDLSEFLNNILTDSLAADISTGDYGTVESIKEEYDLTEEFRFYEGH